MAILGSGVVGGLYAKYLLPCCCSHNSFEFGMQHDHVLKKFNFDLLTLGVEGGVLRENICYHVAAFVIPFYLICNMTNFEVDLYFMMFYPSLKFE